MEQSRIEESVSVSSSSVDIFDLFLVWLGLTLFFSPSSTHSIFTSYFLSFLSLCAVDQQAPRWDEQVDHCERKAARSVFVPKRRTELLGS
jgi:hypothetical protein